MGKLLQPHEKVAAGVVVSNPYLVDVLLKDG